MKIHFLLFVFIQLFEQIIGNVISAANMQTAAMPFVCGGIQDGNGKIEISGEVVIGLKHKMLRAIKICLEVMKKKD